MKFPDTARRRNAVTASLAAGVLLICAFGIAESWQISCLLFFYCGVLGLFPFSGNTLDPARAKLCRMLGPPLFGLLMLVLGLLFLKHFTGSDTDSELGSPSWLLSYEILAGFMLWIGFILITSGIINVLCSHPAWVKSANELATIAVWTVAGHIFISDFALHNADRVVLIFGGFILAMLLNHNQTIAFIAFCLLLAAGSVYIFPQLRSMTEVRLEGHIVFVWLMIMSSAGKATEVIWAGAKTGQTIDRSATI